MQKIVINSCFGGYCLSHKGVMAYAKRKGIKLYTYIDERDNERNRTGHYKEYDGKENTSFVYYFKKPIKKNKPDDRAFFSYNNIKRDDPDLIAVVKKLGKKANGTCADLKVVEIPDGVKWEIDEYDGNESIEEVHQKWS